MNEYAGVKRPTDWDSRSTNYQNGWEDGVDFAQQVVTPAGTLQLTGWSRDAVRAFGFLVSDNQAQARNIVRDMSPRDRAVLVFDLEELSRIVGDAELSRFRDERQAADLLRVPRDSRSVQA